MQQVFQVASAEILPTALQLDFHVIMKFSSPTASRDAVKLEVGFAAQAASRLTV